MKKLRISPVFCAWLVFALVVNLPLWLVDVHEVHIKWRILWVLVIAGLIFVIEALRQYERLKEERDA